MMMINEYLQYKYLKFMVLRLIINMKSRKLIGTEKSSLSSENLYVYGE